MSFAVQVSDPAAAAIPTGSVNLVVNGSTVATTTLDGLGRATFSRIFAAAGQYQVAAVYQGSATFQGSASSPLTHSVSDPLPPPPPPPVKIETTLVLALSPATIREGEMVTLTATLSVSGIDPSGPPEGAVAFYDGDVLLGLVLLGANLKAALTINTLAPGVHTLRGAYAGDAVYAGDPAPDRSYTVSPSAVEEKPGTVLILGGALAAAVIAALVSLRRRV